MLASTQSEPVELTSASASLGLIHAYCLDFMLPLPGSQPQSQRHRNPGTNITTIDMAWSLLGSPDESGNPPPSEFWDYRCVQHPTLLSVS